MILVFHNPNSTILGLISSLYSLGSIASLPFVPFVSDRFGRRIAILFGSVVMIIGAVLQMAAQDCESARLFSRECCLFTRIAVAMFVIARFLLGFGIPFAIVAASSMIGELSYPNERARIGSLFNASWFLGTSSKLPVSQGSTDHVCQVPLLRPAPRSAHSR